jgi:SM-20-related protein
MIYARSQGVTRRAPLNNSRGSVVPDVAETIEKPSVISNRNPQERGSVLTRVDNLLQDDQRKLINNFLHGPGWKFGWKSRANTDVYSFWHKHFAGAIQPDHLSSERAEEPYDCADELQRKAPLLHTFWQGLEKTALKGHTLVRCYANGHTYGSDGSLHTDSVSPRSFTSIYYPHERWSPNWGGETVFFNQEETDIVASIYPKPNRLLIFQGTIPHVARGVSRTCPVLRITLMFKTETKDG